MKCTAVDDDRDIRDDAWTLKWPVPLGKYQVKKREQNRIIERQQRKDGGPRGKIHDEGSAKTENKHRADVSPLEEGDRQRAEAGG